GFMFALVVLCGPLMLASRLAAAGSALFYVGLCASFFLPLALYGPALALIQGLSPPQVRSTITGVTMLVINVFAIAIGTVVAGARSDRLLHAGSGTPLTTVILGTDVLVILGAVFFALAARGEKVQGSQAPVMAH